jgi:hypothetical protein
VAGAGVGGGRQAGAREWPGSRGGLPPRRCALPRAAAAAPRAATHREGRDLHGDAGDARVQRRLFQRGADLGDAKARGKAALERVADLALELRVWGGGRVGRVRGRRRLTPRVPAAAPRLRPSPDPQHPRPPARLPPPGPPTLKVSTEPFLKRRHGSANAILRRAQNRSAPSSLAVASGGSAPPSGRHASGSHLGLSSLPPLPASWAGGAAATTPLAASGASAWLAAGAASASAGASTAGAPSRSPAARSGVRRTRSCARGAPGARATRQPAGSIAAGSEGRHKTVAAAAAARRGPGPRGGPGRGLAPHTEGAAPGPPAAPGANYETSEDNRPAARGSLGPHLRGPRPRMSSRAAA